MVAKRKSTGTPGKSPVKSPPTKKAKVADPVADNVAVILDALDNETGDQLPESVVDMLKVVAKPSLSSFAEQRGDLEAKFASLVGEGLQQAAASLRAKADEAGGTQAAQQAAATAAGNVVDAAKAAVDLAAAAQDTAEEAKESAESAEDDAGKAESKHEKDHKDLDKTRAKYEGETETLQNALEVIQSPNSTSKDGKKVQTLLRACSASASVVDALPGALGTSEGFGTLVLTEAAKCVQVRQAEVAEKLGNWDAYVASIASTAEQLANNVAAASELVAARSGAVQAAQEGLKTAKGDLKAAEAQAKAAGKAVDAAAKQGAKATAIKDSADGALAAFQFLFSRTEVQPVNGGENGEEES